jgi:hypothetical protein
MADVPAFEHALPCFLGLTSLLEHMASSEWAEAGSTPEREKFVGRFLGRRHVVGCMCKTPLAEDKAC